MMTLQSRDRIEEILRDSSPLFAEAMRGFLLSWRRDDADLSCLFIAVMEIAADSRRLEEWYEETRDDARDMTIEVGKLRAEIESLRSLISLRHQGPQELRSVPPLLSDHSE